MTTLRYFSLVLALLSLGGWWAIHRPASPTDALPMVRYTAFELAGQALARGENIATHVRTWDGVTAAHFNPASALLTISISATHTEADLLAKLLATEGEGIRRKVFDTATGPQCPVPAQFIAALPKYLLGASLCFLGISLLTFLGRGGSINRSQLT